MTEMLVGLAAGDDDDKDRVPKDGAGEPEQPKPKESEYGHETGVSQNLPFSTPWIDKTYEIFRDEEEQAPTVRQLAAMRRTDGQARALYRLMTLPIRSALRTATVVPAQGTTDETKEELEAETEAADLPEPEKDPLTGLPDPEVLKTNKEAKLEKRKKAKEKRKKESGSEEAEFVNQMFTLPPNGGGMKTPLHKIMAQVLMALFDGFAAFEMVYWAPDKGPLKGKITLEKLSHRPAETITFLTDERGDFAGFRQRATIHGKVVDVKIDLEDAFYYAAQEEERPFYGVSYFQSAFYHYDKKTKLYFIAHLAAQRNAVGTRVGTWPVNASEKDKLAFKRSLADMGMAQYIASPESFSVEVMKDGTQFNFLEYINHHNSQMSKSVLAAFFDDSQGGDNASLVDFGQQSDALFMLMLQTIMDEIAEQINTFIIPKFIDWNFGTGKYPKFQWGKFTDEQKNAIRTTFDALAVAGQPNVTPEFLFELEKKVAEEMGLEIDYDEIEAEMKAQEEMQKAADEAALGFGVQQPQVGPDGQPVGPPDPSDPMAGAFGPPPAPPDASGGPGAGSPPMQPSGGGFKPGGPPKKPMPLTAQQDTGVSLVMHLSADEMARQLLLSAVEEESDDDDNADSSAE